MALAHMPTTWLKRPAAQAAAIYLALATLWVVASDKLLVLFVGDPLLIAKIGMLKGIAFVAITSILVYILAASEGVGDDDPCPATPPAPATSRQLWLIGSFIGLAALVPLVGYVIVKLQEPRIEQKALEDLRAISNLKAGQIQSWLDEWRADADMLISNAGFVESLDQWHRERNLRAKKYLLDTLQSLEHVHRYEMELVDVDGRRLLVGEARPDNGVPRPQPLVTTALRSGRILSSDLYQDGAGRIRLDLVVPLILRDGQKPRAVGAAVMRPPVEKLLFPLIQTWPTPSPSGETFLIRRDGNDVLYLNELRFRKGTAHIFRLPVASHPKLPAAMAILSQQAQVVSDGIDYRGKPVLAATHPIAGTPWHLVAKLDRDEVLAPLQDLIHWVGVLALVAVATVAIVVTMLWRQQQRANRLAVAAQAAQKDKLLRLFYDLPFIGMTITSPESRRFVYVNDYLCHMLGYRHDELLDLTWMEVIHPDDIGVVMAESRRLRTGKVDCIQLETRYLGKDGRCGIAAVDMRGAMLPDGRIQAVVSMIQDITERKRAERELQQFTTELEERVDERTAELLAANQELQAFAYAVSHDLKAPLRTIGNFAGLLGNRYRNQLDGDGLLFLDFIQQGSRRMTKLIDDLLNYAQIDQGCRDTQPVDLPAALNAVLAELQEEIRERAAEVRLAVPAGAVLANPSGLAQVLRNLIGNALKYSAHAKPPMIHVRGELKAGKYVLQVRDNGIGFDMADHDRIFAIFQRLHTYDEYQGTGIGLALVKIAMKRMGGRVWAESAAGKGASFHVEFDTAKVFRTAEEAAAT